MPPSVAAEDGVFLPRWSGEKGKHTLMIITCAEILMNSCFVVIGVVVGVVLDALLL